MRFYDRMLTACEICRIPEGTDPGETQLVRRYQFNEGTGAVAKDSAPGAGRGLYYDQLPMAILSEAPATFAHWWDTDEPTGQTRFDAIGAADLLDNGGVTLAAGIEGN